MHTEIGRWVLRIEGEAVLQLAERLDDQFAEVVELILHAPGKVILTGVGKSAHIAAKIAATLNSVGTPAVWLHATEAVHGDVGIVQRGDVALIFSKSGETPEVKGLLPVLRERGAYTIACVGNPDSSLARGADKVIDLSVQREACPHGLTPTASTTVALAFGDALAIALMQAKRFGPEDFAATHPGGSLGKRLLLRVKDIADPTLPAVSEDAPFKEVLYAITSGRKGAVAVLAPDSPILRGIITDGDIRRALEKYEPTHLLSLRAKDVATKNPKTIELHQKAFEALEMMRMHKVSQLIVLEGGKPWGMIHFHDLIREGIQ
ncbi:MAG: KpsF/GutQ family sugar-phosphate isomerase [Bacteroidia bacterium]|nr:KpsF/GutQ family sugar-phosphate isomerase [Bacteroidia bacterium]MCX7763703.1 KpsF/GutQ family sugar-phosphate isomerase [Bacteroidia bacterium]MDW8058060.1 KpsF/GutQ family sugar-phosphate isomerase [Bacteroidia bacterium]